jgi:sugar phosphate isomerase/epimerase
MKIGLSTWCLLGLDVVSAVRAVGDAGFEYVELWGEVPHAYPDWVDRGRIKDALSSYDMVLTMHAPFTDLNPSNPFQPMKGAVEHTLENFVKFSEHLGARIVTVHPGSVHNEGLVPMSAQNSVDILRKMTRTADGRLKINAENMTKSRSKYHFPLASTVESLDLILSEVEGLQLTLDTGHAHANGQNLASLTDRFGSKLTEIHLNDNMGASDDHLIPGQGTADTKGVIEKVASRDVLICLELDPHRYSPDDIMRASAVIRDGGRS